MIGTHDKGRCPQVFLQNADVGNFGVSFDGRMIDQKLIQPGFQFVHGPRLFPFAMKSQRQLFHQQGFVRPGNLVLSLIPLQPFACDHTVQASRIDRLAACGRLLQLTQTASDQLQQVGPFGQVAKVVNIFDQLDRFDRLLFAAQSLLQITCNRLFIPRNQYQCRVAFDLFATFASEHRRLCRDIAEVM